MEDRIYPKIPSMEIDEIINDKISKSRAIEIINKQKELDKDLKHYKKLRDKWKKANSVIKVLGIGIGSTLAVGGVVVGGIMSSGIVIPILIPTIIGGVGVIETTISTCVAATYIKKKINKFNLKYDLINTYLNRLYHLYHRSIEDGKITLEEMDEFNKLITKYETEMIKFNSNDAYEIPLQKLLDKADKEARSEYTVELINKMKDEKKKELEKNF